MASPISKVVIIYLENHTFDNVASEVAGTDGDPSLPPAPDVVTPDPPHDHAAWMRRNDPGPRGARRERYGPRQLPRLYGLMGAFALCDAYFSDFAGNSFPNHAFSIGADAEGATRNPSPTHPITLQTPGVPVRLEGAGKSWANYGGGFAFPHYRDPRMHANVKNTFLADAAAGRLPHVSWVYAPRGEDFHPGALITGGSRMSASDTRLGSAVDAVARGPDWGHVVIFVTFDDWGGWYDHVVPPLVETSPNGDSYRFGSRVPCVVVSPYARPRYVSHVRSSNVSLVAYIERLFGLPPSPNPDAARRTSAPDEQAMADCINTGQAPLQPPLSPPIGR
jgi:phospholipase C